jgi:hypothetical protein
MWSGVAMIPDLPPAPWEKRMHTDDYDPAKDYPGVVSEGRRWVREETMIDFAVLARNALEVMQRRGWGVMRLSGPPMWKVVDWEGRQIGIFASIDPFTALIEADRWLTEREKETSHGR